MKFNKKYTLATEFENLFTFKTKKEEVEHEAKMIMFRFFSELEKINNENPIKKKELAIALNTSASYITQLYQGDKLINLLTLAKLQEIYNVTFNITAKNNSRDYSEEIVDSLETSFSENKTYDKDGYRLYVSKNLDYRENSVGELSKKSINFKVA